MRKLQIGLLSAGLAIVATGVWIGRHTPPVPNSQPCQVMPDPNNVVVKDPQSGKCWHTDKTGCTAPGPCPTKIMPWTRRVQVTP